MKQKERAAARTTIEPPALTKRTLALFQKALEERNDLKKWIGELSARSNLTVRDRLCLAFYKQQLSFREPPLPPGAALNARSVREYWVSAPEKYKEHQSRINAIETFLKSTADLGRETLEQIMKMLDLISSDRTTFQLMFPILGEVFKKPAGRPISRPSVAVRALQLKFDSGKTWEEITSDVCDCGKRDHDEYCQENLRQSVRRLRDLLQECGVEVPSI